MSRIGKKPVALPPKVGVEYQSQTLTVNGPKGTLKLAIHPDVSLEVTPSEILVVRPTENRRHRAVQGVMRSLVQNMVTGVSAGFQKDLEIQGIGYRAAVQGSNLTLNVGFSHAINYAVPSDVAVDVKDQRLISVKGIDRQRVGQVAAVIRGFKPPEPYKGTGIRYAGEHVVKKEGKAGAK